MKPTLFIPLFAATTAALPLLAQPVAVLTYNIRYDNPADGEDAWPLRRAFLVGQLRFHAPDIFGIQEGLKRQVDFLQEQLPEFEHVGVGRDDGRGEGEYAALFFRKNRFRAVKSGTFWLSERPDTVSKGWDAALPRICTWALLADKETKRKLWVFNTHFDHIGQEARKSSAALILNQIREKNTDGHPVVLMGDLNATPSSEPVWMFSQEMHDSRAQSIEPPFGPPGTFSGFRFKEPVELRIDYIFVSHDLLVRKYAVLSDSWGCHYPSDHLPVFAKLEYASKGKKR
ncbi:MAG: endonuclease/exonuclease/phosphatase family protein [Saprospiraceae bacterium]